MAQAEVTGSVSLSAVDELWPRPVNEIDIAARLSADQRPPWVDRPWVVMVMIASLDGAVAVDGRSGDLGGPADHARFVAVRRLVDAIVVGARTVALEDYRPTTVPIAVVSGSLSVDPGARLFSDPRRPPLLYTTAQAARTRGRDFDGIAEVVSLGDSLDPVGVLHDLRRRGTETVALEGGPMLNGQMLAADVVDEIVLSISPLVVVGDAARIAHGALVEPPHRFALDRVLTADDLLFARYLRRRPDPKMGSS